MARHDQKPKPLPTNWICGKCREYECRECLDTLRATAFPKLADKLCGCKHEFMEVVNGLGQVAGSQGDGQAGSADGDAKDSNTVEQAPQKV